MIWPKRVEKNVLPLSVEKKDLAKALKEWHYNGEYCDLEEPTAICQLCDHRHIRFQFTIENPDTVKKLLVGSKCIVRFGIPAVDSQLGRLSAEATEQKLSRDRSKMIAETKEKGVITALSKLGHEGVNADRFLDNLKQRGAFTPEQLSLLIGKLNKHNIEHDKSDFKMVIKRKREKEQLAKMDRQEVDQIWDCMTSTQRTYWNNNHGQTISAARVEVN
jgi:hypothetical protein